MTIAGTQIASDDMRLLQLSLRPQRRENEERAIYIESNRSYSRCCLLCLPGVFTDWAPAHSVFASAVGFNVSPVHLTNIMEDDSMSTLALQRSALSAASESNAHKGLETMPVDSK